MTTDAAPQPFAMLGDPAAEACQGDACLVPGTATAPVTSAIQEKQPPQALDTPCERSRGASNSLVS
jgi:hypothetical protein